MSTTQIDIPDSADLQTSGKDWLAVARSTKVVDQQSLDSANDALRTIREFKKQVTDRLSPAVEAAHKAHKALTMLRNETLQPFDDAERAIKGACATYAVEQERKAAAARREAEAIARQQAEDERLARAAALEAQGRIAEAHAEVSTPVVVAPPEPVAPPVAIPKGMSIRETWSARVDSPLALIQFVAANPGYLNLLEPNQSALNDMARGMKAAMQIPGVVAVPSSSVAVR